ncbi:MAG: MTH1187 family thiamine-binding protein [Desulfitobacterium hafniense]|nr:MTH1187 family thiamine-binding protein [Desulfitobacterium hafniense]
MAIVAVNLTPIGEGTSVSKYIAAAEKVLLNKPQIKRQLGPLFTTLEGDLDEILQAVREMQEEVFALGVERIATTIKIDDRRDKAITMDGKVKSVEDKLSQEK